MNTHQRELTSAVSLCAAVAAIGILSRRDSDIPAEPIKPRRRILDTRSIMGGATKWLFVVLMVTTLAVISSRIMASTQSEQYLPYRVSAPGPDIMYPPAPYNESLHGSPLRNTQPETNMVGRPGVMLPERGPLPSQQSPISDIPPGSGDRGLWLTAGSGIYAANDAQVDLVIPDVAIGTTIYAPTHMPPGGSCIEATTAHWRYEGMQSTAHGLGFWDWCVTDGTGGWQVLEFINSNWMAKYVRRFKGEFRFWVQVFSDAPNSWKALLYNFNAGQWEEKTAIAGTSMIGNTGWTMWESHYMMDVAGVCPKLHGIQASDIKVYINGSWEDMDPSNAENSLGPYGKCWLDGSYKFRLSPKWDLWQARTPRVK